MRPLVMRGEESVEPQTCQKTARLRHPAGFTYDAAGDLTADGVNTYSWNAEAHLKSAAGVTYTYDGDLRRVKKSSGTLYWYCATCGNVLAESDLSGNLTSEYTFFGDRRVARRDVSSGNVYYIFSDRLGSYRTLTGSSGNVQGESDYYPFGAERVISSTMTDNFRFAGMEWDSEDGLNHTLYRKFTPAQGRWESPDPVRGCTSFPQGQNLYAYVKDSPTNAVDPRGDQNCDPWIDPSCGPCDPWTDPYCNCDPIWGCECDPVTDPACNGGDRPRRITCTCYLSSPSWGLNRRCLGCGYECGCTDGTTMWKWLKCSCFDEYGLKPCPSSIHLVNGLYSDWELCGPPIRLPEPPPHPPLPPIPPPFPQPGPLPIPI
jgi:RHS repeat-associated protein